MYCTVSSFVSLPRVRRTARAWIDRTNSKRLCDFWAETPPLAMSGVRPRTWPERTRPFSGAELAIQVHGRADQCEVRERLREVAEQLAGCADLLAVEPDVVGVGEHLLEGQTRLVHAARPRESLDVPESADREGPVAAGQAVGRDLRVVAVDQAVRDQFAGDRVQGREPARVGRRYELREWHQKHRRVEHGGLVVLDERLALLVPPALHHLAVDLVPSYRPVRHVRRQPALPRDPDRALECDPRHQLRVGELLAP